MTAETREFHYPSEFWGRFNGSLNWYDETFQSTICHPSQTCCQLHIHLVSPNESTATKREMHNIKNGNSNSNSYTTAKWSAVKCICAVGVSVSDLISELWHNIKLIWNPRSNSEFNNHIKSEKKIILIIWSTYIAFINLQ